MKVVAQNRRARFDFEILDTVEAGIMLSGAETKSCRAGHVNLSGAYVSFFGGKAVLKKAKISPYAYASQTDYDPEHDRPLLLKASELARFAAQTDEKGLAIVPLEVRAGKYIKVLLGVGRGRKKIDKRARIKEREVGRKLREGREV